MKDFDYSAPAEFYGWRGRNMRRSALTYRRFATAAEAIRHAVEDVAPAGLGSCAVEVDGKRIQGRDIKTLYADSRFPLRRASQAA